MSYDAIIFDNDGVLTTPNDRAMLLTAARRAFQQVDLPAPKEAHVEGLVAGVTVEWFEEVCAEYDLDPAEFWSIRDATASKAQQVAIHEGRKTLYDDAEAVLDLERDLAIVSTNQHETIEFVLEHFELDAHFETYYGREPTVESLRRKKPAPHYVERALADLGTRNALFVGDSESDVRAAANAGIDSAFVRRSHRVDYALSVEPTYEIESLDELPGLIVDG